MKITDPTVIKSGENELIDSITADMDWGAIGKVFLEKHKLDIDEDVEYKSGDIIVHANQIAYKLNFDVKVNLSILLDREGNYIALSSDLDPDAVGEKGDEEGSPEPEGAETEAEDKGEEVVFESDGDETSDDKKPKEKDLEAELVTDDAAEQPEDKG
jgi:hypothetical protein